MKCMVCNVINGAEQAHVLRDTDDIIAYRSLTPLTPVHIIIAPKKHIPSLTALTPQDAEVIAKIFLLIPELAREKAIFQCGFRVIANTGPDAGEEELNPHLHFHLLGGTTLTNYLA